MEKIIRHFNTSPSNVNSMAKRRTNEFFTAMSGCFGVRLDELCARDGQGVPLIMIQLCAFLRAVGGLYTEGVFRVNGNSRVIENLRNAADSFMSTGDGDLFLAHLERHGDIHSVASLIKLFLRELPIGLVPPSHTKELLGNYNIHAEDSLVVIERVIRSLPPPNFRLLEYLCYFLRQMMQYQNQNKMNSTSIGIVFGPNVFRIPRESEGLTSQNVVNHIMSELVERSDVLFARKSPLEVPSGPLARKNHSGVGLNPNGLVDYEAVAARVPMEGHRQPSANYRPRAHRSHADRSPFLDTEPVRDAASEVELWRHGREHQMITSPSDTESQSMMLNLATDVAEQLSATLQACLRNCVRQHALLLSHRRSHHLPIHSSATAGPQRLGDLAVGPTVSPLCACSQPTCPPPILQVDSNTSRINGGSNSDGTYMRKPQDSPLPPQSQPQALSGSFRKEVSQERTGSASCLPIARSGDGDTDEVQHLQDVGFIVSTKRPSSWRTSDSGWRPTDEGTAAATGEQRKEERRQFRARLATYDPAPAGSSQLRTPLHLLQGSRRTECVVKAYEEIAQRLAEKRRAANRSERLIDMTLQELETEKLVIQRALLAFETTYGRPRERNDRVVMRPVYDRYRCVKRLLAGAASHHCSSPNTPARIFAPPDMLDSATGATDTAAPLATPHSLYSEHVSSLALLAEPPHASTGDPVTLAHRCPSIDTSDYPQLHNSAASSRCTSLVTSANSKAPDEWFGSLGVSTRPSGQRVRSPRRYPEVELVDEREYNTGIVMRQSEEVVRLGGRAQESEEEGEEQTVGRRTPISRSPLLSPSSSPSPPAYQHPRRRQQHRQHADAPTSAALTQAQWSIVGHEGAHSQLLSQPPRHQHQIRLLVGDDPESGKPLDQAIADCVAKYATFTLSELQIELTSVKDSKKTLQKFLKEFEHDFERKHGRKVEMEDRQPLNPEYLHYKMLKARLTSLERLLEARSTKV
ncbi:Protein FAM13A [Echinococcus granulosus]|uniref:Protein fam13a n=1 Tax=Echinococcus granulosus TaxID=6210 RepID=A0A068WDV3_ECHGR|nr:Protein FAM13A [Echinococcus granulosus]CDS15781.1 protein fam13a [Echinococcus granulosus]